MKELEITSLEAGQRFDKYLDRYLANAGKGFIYKMLRKKNITLNNKKADGSEKLCAGDIVKIFFKDETLDTFIGSSNKLQSAPSKKSNHSLNVLYEDNDIILVNKPKGVLSQKAKPDDITMCEIITEYLVDSGSLTKEQLLTFHPGVCNRLDRNTSGILAAGKSIMGLQQLSEAFANRSARKYYIALVSGNVTQKRHVEGYLVKNEKNNTVTITLDNPGDGDYIATEYIPIVSSQHLSLVKVHLITGKTHQIRAHMASLSHPLIGDYKYGLASVNEYYKKKYKVSSQLLHSYELILPERNLNINAGLTQEFVSILKGEGIWQPGIPEALEALH